MSIYISADISIPQLCNDRQFRTHAVERVICPNTL